MRPYRLSPEAQADLVEIKLHLVRVGGARLARRVLGGIRQKLQLLADNPGLGHSRQDLTDENVKFLAVFAYLIVYDPLIHPIGIARILHGSRDLETTFRSRPPQA